LWRVRHRQLGLEEAMMPTTSTIAIGIDASGRSNYESNIKNQTRACVEMLCAQTTHALHICDCTRALRVEGHKHHENDGGEMEHAGWFIRTLSSQSQVVIRGASKKKTFVKWLASAVHDGSGRGQSGSNPGQ
jgi:hypothetical protein